MINGVEIFDLKKIHDDRGKIMHMLRCDSPHFEKFGEIYFSVVYPGKVKAWHKHKKMTLNYAVPKGTIKLVLYDDRKNSPTKGSIEEIITGENDYRLIKIPPGLWNGFQGISEGPSIVANCATIPHDSEEIIRIDPFNNDIPYKWE